MLSPQKHFELAEQCATAARQTAANNGAQAWLWVAIGTLHQDIAFAMQAGDVKLTESHPPIRDVDTPGNVVLFRPQQ